MYLGGLGEDPSSEHLVSRQEVGAALGEAGVPVVELRAAVVLGAGSISFEMLRYLTERLPFMVCPRWVRTALQPIALRDVLQYLVGALDVKPGVYEIGGADVTTYREMIGAYADVRGLTRRLIVDVPLLTPRLSSYWVDFVTPVDSQVSHSLIESSSTEVVVARRRPGRALRSTSNRWASVTRSGSRSTTRRPRSRAACSTGRAGCSTACTPTASRCRSTGWTRRRSTPTSTRSAATSPGTGCTGVGGRASPFGRLVGERWELRRPRAVAPGEPVDWWVIVRRTTRVLVLRGVGWFVGDGWLGFRVGDERLVEVGVLRPKGLPGFLYWKVLLPIHHWAFSRQAVHRLERVRGRRTQ